MGSFNICRFDNFSPDCNSMGYISFKSPKHTKKHNHVQNQLNNNSRRREKPIKPITIDDKYASTATYMKNHFAQLIEYWQFQYNYIVECVPVCTVKTDEFNNAKINGSCNSIHKFYGNIIFSSNHRFIELKAMRCDAYTFKMYRMSV